MDRPRPFVFKRFRRNMIKPGSVVVIIGKKGTGKTTVLGDLCHWFRATPEVTLFQKTYRTNPIFHDVVPSTFCHDRWKRDVVARLMRRQETRNEKRMKQGRPPIYHTIIVDDLACSPEFVRDPQLEELVMNARWLKINLLFTLQDALKIVPALRNNADWVFALKELNPNAKKRLHEHYFGQLGSNPKQFNKLFDELTHNRGVVVLNNTSLSTRMEDNYFHWRSTIRDFHEHPEIRRWKMGSKQYWAFHYQNIRGKQQDDDDLEKNDAITVQI